MFDTVEKTFLAIITEMQRFVDKVIKRLGGFYEQLEFIIIDYGFKLLDGVKL